jgi:hypothetical protein
MPPSADIGRRDAQLHKNMEATNWWISGGTDRPTLYGADFVTGIVFTNGQRVLIGQKGLFHMNRPKAEITATPGVVALDTNYVWNACTNPTLGLHCGVREVLPKNPTSG